MPRTLLVDAVGSCIAIDLSGLDPDDEAAVRTAWADAIIPDGTDAAPEPAGTVSALGTDRVQMLSSLSQTVTLAAIDAARGRAWMLHAAGIAMPDGKVVVFVGPSGRGKTTAARALGETYGYVSDETIAIDEDGRVWPYRKPLSVIEDPAAPKTQMAPSDLNLTPLPAAELHVAAIVMLDRDAAHPEAPVVEDSDLGDVLGELVAQTSFLPDQHAALRFIAALATATGGIRTVKYREAVTLPAIVPQLVARPAAPLVLPELPQHEAPASDVALAASRGDAADSALTGARFSRVAVADEVALEHPDRIAILTVDAEQRGHVSVLGGIAPAVWRVAENATLGQFVDAATSTYGEPDGFDARAAVLIATGELLDAGLLTSDEPLLTRRADVAWVEGEERIIALPLSPSGDGAIAAPTALAGSAALIWEWLEQPITLTQLTARAAAAAGAAEVGNAATVVEDVADFVAQLVESRLIASQPAA